MTTEQNYVHLIGVGKVKAIPAQELKINDIIVWNYGSTSKVVEIVKQTKSSIFIKTQSKNNSGANEIYSKTFRKNRLVAIYPKK